MTNCLSSLPPRVRRARCLFSGNVVYLANLTIRQREVMLKRKAINLLAILTALAMCLCVMIPTKASAAPVDYSSTPSSELPASLGRDLHGRKTESIDIEGKGTLQATVGYDNGTFQIIDFDGTLQEIPFSKQSSKWRGSWRG
ncbi:hypothetical protein ACT4MG_02630 [Bifidobacterium longum subsp. infantis]|uniref:hypothetical protein n=1 Tax=Bifidobacterium longum TaxID=216816 RepID=UPI004033E2BC